MNEQENTSTRNVQVEKIGERMNLKADVESVSLNLNIEQLLELQDKYSTLQAECRRFADWVLNLSRNCASVAIQFSDDSLNLVANTLIANFRPKSQEEKQAEKDRISRMVDEAMKKTLKDNVKCE